MVTKTTKTILCDVCGKEAKESLEFVIDRQMNAAGSIESVWYDVDLCSMHLREMTQKCCTVLGISFSDDLRTIFRKMERYEKMELSQHIDTMIEIWSKMSAEDRMLAMEIEKLP